jgi:hypothetical protein
VPATKDPGGIANEEAVVLQMPPRSFGRSRRAMLIAGRFLLLATAGSFERADDVTRIRLAAAHRNPVGVDRRAELGADGRTVRQ